MSRAPGLLAGYLADLALGDPPRWHPVAGFGRCAAALERRFYAPTRTRGVIVTGVLVGGAAALSARAGARRPLVLATVTWAALGGRTLRREARRVADLIEHGDLEAARSRLGWLCGRDGAQLDGDALARAVVESLAENTSDAVVGALLWGAIAGPAGIAGYRAANTLDAMFGHRDERYADFGWAAARLDDALNWPAARMSAALTCAAAPLVGGSPTLTLRVARRDGLRHPSPNAGVAEAAFAGALGVSLGGELTYAGHAELRPRLGDGCSPTLGDVRRAMRLSFAVATLATALCAAAAR
ncbi:MAG TPA: cobalamin biosynthesis protein [Solirubrobacteraceae bacterium]|jgi:adenosylcobinamide-phosphate synthase|nr:cobalamin biosynthesis protein [Solirubrobacteraceae bacterium]